MIVVLCLGLMIFLFNILVEGRYAFTDSFSWGVLIASVVIATLLGGSVGLFKTDCRETSYTSQLGSLNDQGLLEGHFFLGTGTIEEKPSFVYYKQISKNQYRLRTVKDDGFTPVVVFEDEAEKPYVKTLHTECAGDINWWWFRLPNELTNQIEFHVPKGSVVSNFNLDGKP